MLDRPFSVLLGVAAFWWVGTIFFETTPHGRLAQTCAPVRWTGNVIGSLAALTSPNSVAQVAEYTDDWDYGCQFTAWRLVYGKAYNEAMAKKGGVLPGDGSGENFPSQNSKEGAPVRSPFSDSAYYKPTYLPNGQMVYQVPNGQSVPPTGASTPVTASQATAGAADDEVSTRDHTRPATDEMDEVTSRKAKRRK